MNQEQTFNNATGQEVNVDLLVSENSVNLGYDGLPWPQTRDAKIWADEFCKRNSASDHGTMLGWFANAIMVGRDGINKTKLANKFTEIVAIHLNVFDQRKDGVWPPNTDLARWKRRYHGIPKEELPPYTEEINSFRIEVDEFVETLVRAIDDV